jgi:peptidoglycan/xylan/chitin deacetylase (PgdA/CDA1 family)
MRLKPPLVLLYHGLGDVRRADDPSNLIVPPARFRRHVELLLRRGYSFVTVSDLVAGMGGGRPRPALCALTFDDGSADNAHVLRELAEELDVPVTLYVCPGLLGRPHPFLRPEAGVRLMDADEVRVLAGHRLFELGAHTNAHTDLSAATADEAYREMSESKAALEQLTGHEVRTFAYPGCRYSPACPEAAERAGYRSAVTCGELGGWRPFELRREPVHALDGPFSFALKARDLYRPLHYSAPGRISRWATRPLRRRWRAYRRSVQTPARSSSRLTWRSNAKRRRAP